MFAGVLFIPMPPFNVFFFTNAFSIYWLDWSLIWFFFAESGRLCKDCHTFVAGTFFTHRYLQQLDWDSSLSDGFQSQVLTQLNMLRLFLPLWSLTVALWLFCFPFQCTRMQVTASFGSLSQSCKFFSFYGRLKWFSLAITHSKIWFLFLTEMENNALSLGASLGYRFSIRYTWQQ